MYHHISVLLTNAEVGICFKKLYILNIDPLTIYGPPECSFWYFPKISSKEINERALPNSGEV